MSCNGTKRTKISRGTPRRRKTALVRGLGLVALLAIAMSAAAQSAPSRPAGLTESVDDGSVTLRWTDPADASITGYEVRYAAAGASFGDWQQHDGERNALTVISLVNFLEYTFQVRAVNRAGPSPFAQISATPFIDIDFIPSFEGRSVDPICYRVGTPVKQRLPGAFAAETYSLSPALPAGLSFDPTSRLITGTPTAVQPATPYTLTASDFEGDQDAIEFTIKVEPDAMPSFGDATVSSQTYRVGSTIADLALPAATGGDGAIAYTLTPALPNGLTFDADARVVTGTPAERSVPTEYVYAATDEDGDTATLTFEIEVEPDSMPDFGGSSIEAQTYRAGSTIADLALPAANGGDGAIAYTLTPALPNGLTFDASARVVAGTPAERSAATEYVYAATDEDGDTATLTFEIEVEPDSMPDFGGSSIEAQTYRAGSTIADLALPAANGGDGAIAYTLTPALPNGLTFDADARVVAGTPAERSAATEYVYAATDEDGDTATLTFEIEVEPDSMPDFGGSSIEAQTYRAGSTIADLALPAANGGDGAVAYTLTPALPSGLTFDADARVVAGTPAEAAARTQYTYAATDEDGDTAALTFEIEVEPDSMPDFGGSSIEAQTYRAGSTIADLTLPAAAGGDGAIAYTLTPALPSGLTFDADARVVAGTPAAAAARTQYTYAATDEDGDTATLTFEIEVEPDSMPDFGGSSIEAQTYRAGSTIADLHLPAADGGDGPLVYTLTPALPSGLTFDAEARVVAGTPAERSAATEYTYAATDEDGDTAALTFEIEVEPDSMPDFGGSSIEAQTYRAGSTIADLALPAANGGDGAVAYTLTPALPSGLTFDADARVVAGTPAAAAARTQYTYAATDEDGDVATLAFAIEVEPDLMPTFGDAAVPAQQYRVSTAIIDLVLPAASGGDGTLNYALTPALPSGLTLDVDALTIAGTPTAQMGSTDYALTATDEDGDTATLTFAVEVGMAITVAIADAAAPEGQELSFVVTLSDAVAVPVTVAYATADGTARAGEDYAAIAGMLTFPAGSTEMAIGVAVVADPRPERDEQFTVALSDLRNAEFADAQAIGTIADDDTERVRGEAMGHSLAVFGRALAADAVDAISGRFQEGPPTTTPLTFSSSTFGADESEFLAAATALRFFDTDSEFGHMPGESKFLGRSSPLDSTVAGAFAGNANTAFALPFGANAADRGKWTLWGRGSTNRVSSQPDAMRVEGNVDTGYLGVDARLPRNTLVGLAVARSSADFEYRQTGVTEGDVSLDMTTVLPYIHWTLCNGLDLWALAGSGQGEATLVDDLGRADTDIDMRLAAFGLRNKLTTWRDLVWSLKADAFVAALEADKVIDALAAADANVERLRVLLEGRREWQRSEQSLLGATIEFGARLDSGDADNGLGAEIGGALDYRNLPAGLGLEARGRYLLAHADSAFDDWGLSVALELDPGDRGTGASLRLAPAWGRPSSGVANLWRADRMLGTGLATRRLDSAQRLDMEVGYGFHAKRAGALRLYGVVSRNDFGAPSYRLGGRTAAGKGFGWSLEVDRLRRFGGDADYGILLGIGNGMGIAAPPIR